MTSGEIPCLLEWVIVGVFTEYGSFSQRERAEEYAQAIQELKGLSCKVVHKSEVKR